MYRWWLSVGMGIGLGLSATSGARARTSALEGVTDSSGARGTVADDPPASSATSPASLQPAHENFAFGAELGFFNPTGLVVRAGSRSLALDVSAGFVPVLLSYGSAESPEYKLLAPLEVTPQLLIHALTFRDDIQGGLRLGYRYNTALGHGATLGGQIGKRVNRTLLLEGLWGISYYPRASERLRGDQVPQGTSFDFPPELGWGLSVGLLFFP